MQINTLKNTTDKLKYNYKNIHITGRHKKEIWTKK